MLEKVNIPEGDSGRWSVRRFTVSADQAKFDAMRGMFRGGRFTPEGTYTRLTRGGYTIMSDTPDEMRDHREPVSRARGHVLINGLGIGMVLGAVLRKPEVETVTVVEISGDVLTLVAPHYASPKVTFVNEDAFAYSPPKGLRYGAVWHDIWDDICAGNLSAMTRLKRKYGRRADWQGCWSERQCRRNR
jgi:hypothetical protein